MNTKYLEENKFDKIKISTSPLWEVVTQYKLLHEFYLDTIATKKFGYVAIKDIRDRIEYIKKHPKAKQRTELEGLLALLGELDD